MKADTRRFILSFTVTLLIAAMISGMAAVTYKGEIMTDNFKADFRTEYESAAVLEKTAGNILTFFFSEEKAAAQFMLILCAALSRLY